MKVALLLLVLASDGGSPFGYGAGLPAKAEVTRPYDLAKLTRQEAWGLDGKRARFRVTLADVHEVYRTAKFSLYVYRGRVQCAFTVAWQGKPPTAFTVERSITVSENQGELWVILNK